MSTITSIAVLKIFLLITIKIFIEIDIIVILKLIFAPFPQPQVDIEEEGMPWEGQVVMFSQNMSSEFEKERK